MMGGAPGSRGVPERWPHNAAQTMMKSKANNSWKASVPGEAGAKAEQSEEAKNASHMERSSFESVSKKDFISLDKTVKIFPENGSTAAGRAKISEPKSDDKCRRQKIPVAWGGRASEQENEDTPVQQSATTAESVVDLAMKSRAGSAAKAALSYGGQHAGGKKGRGIRENESASNEKSGSAETDNHSLSQMPVAIPFSTYGGFSLQDYFRPKLKEQESEARAVENEEIKWAEMDWTQSISEAAGPRGDDLSASLQVHPTGTEAATAKAGASKEEASEKSAINAKANEGDSRNGFEVLKIHTRQNFDKCQRPKVKNQSKDEQVQGQRTDETDRAKAEGVVGSNERETQRQTESDTEGNTEGDTEDKGDTRHDPENKEHEDTGEANKAESWWRWWKWNQELGRYTKWKKKNPERKRGVLKKHRHDPKKENKQRTSVSISFGNITCASEKAKTYIIERKMIFFDWQNITSTKKQPYSS